MPTIQLRRGLKANIPSTASLGEPIVTTDTHELYVGTGSAATPIQISPSNIINYGLANGVASLDSNGLLPTSQLPSLALTDTYVVASQSAMLALAAHMGDVAVRTDISETFILSASPASTLANWVQVLAPGSPVQSVNGQTGTVVLTTDNVAQGTTNLYFNGKTLDNLPDGTTYARPLATALSSGQVDLSKAGVVNKTLAFVTDSSTRFAVSAVDANKKALVDLAQTGQVGGTADNLIDAPTASRANSTAYALGAVVKDSNGNCQQVTVAGTSGTSTPTWSTTKTGFTVDGTVTWENVGTALYARVLASALTSNQVDLSLSGVVNKTTTYIAEGTNLYFTTARAQAVITADYGIANGIAQLSSTGALDGGTF